MILWMKAKLTTIIIAAVAVFTVAGAGAVMASQSHDSSSSTPRASAGGTSQQQQQEQQEQQNGFEAHGVIQQVNFDQGSTASGNLDFLPNGEQTAIKVVFTTSTKIEVSQGSGDSSSQNNNNGTNNAQPGVLQSGMSAEVKGAKQADGSVLASNIEADNKNANDNDGNDENNEQGDQELVGVIQSIDQNAGTFVLLPDKQTATVTIAFDAKTNMDDGQSDGGKAALTQGAHVQVEVIKRSDGSLYAKEIKSVSGNDGESNNSGDGTDHNGTPTPTPGSGDSGGNGGSGN